MKTRLLALSFASLLAIGTLSSCSSDVTKKTENGEEVIITVGNTEYTADDLMAKYATTTAGASAYYNAINRVLVNHAVETNDEMKKDVENEVNRVVRDARNNAANNGTSYRSELSTLLTAEGADDLDELREIYTLERKTTRLQKQFYDAQTDALTAEYIETTNPYHVKHILVNTSNAGTSFYQGTISEDESRAIASVVRRLASGNETFGTVAQSASGDGSAQQFGDLGIMDRDTSFVSEFKMAVYNYDYFYNTSIADADKAKLDIPETVKGADASKNISVENVIRESVKTIPYSEVMKLEEYASITRNTNTLTEIENGDANYYPRNILFNNYFNNHSLSFIVKDAAATGVSNARFKTINVDGTNVDVLTDENSNPILVTRAGTGSVGEESSGYQGIHFIVIEQSAVAAPSVVAEYYSQDIPTTEAEKAEKRYVTFVNSTSQDAYSERAEEIEEKITGFDAQMDFRIYQQEVAKEGIVIDEDIKNLVDNYISITKERTASTKQETYMTTWTDFIRKLQIQMKMQEANTLDLSVIDRFFN